MPLHVYLRSTIGDQNIAGNTTLIKVTVYGHLLDRLKIQHLPFTFFTVSLLRRKVRVRQGGESNYTALPLICIHGSLIVSDFLNRCMIFPNRTGNIFRRRLVISVRTAGHVTSRSHRDTFQDYGQGSLYHFCTYKTYYSGRLCCH